jgi:hypothetical protein
MVMVPRHTRSIVQKERSNSVTPESAWMTPAAALKRFRHPKEMGEQVIIRCLFFRIYETDLSIENVNMILQSLIRAS